MTTIVILTLCAPLWLWAQRKTHRRNRMHPDEARDAVRRKLGGAKCVHIVPGEYPLPPLEIIRIATYERAYVHAGSGVNGEMTFRRGDSVNPPQPMVANFLGDLREHGYWPFRRRRCPVP